MDKILDAVMDRMASALCERDFLDLVFGEHRSSVMEGRPVLLFGAGNLGRELCETLRNRGVNPVAFCDNDSARVGGRLGGLPIISFDELNEVHRDALVVIANRTHGQSIAEQLMGAEWPIGQIRCKPDDLGDVAAYFYLYAINSLVSVQSTNPKEFSEDTLLATLKRDEDLVHKAYHLLADEASRELFLMRLALIVSGEHFELFRRFMSAFSAPILESGADRTDLKTEEHYYFRQAILGLREGEVYLDCGAADGDTVETFVTACREQGIDYGRIYAFEPDPDNFKALQIVARDLKDVHCHNQGLWSETTTLRFISSREAIHNEAGTIAEEGDIEIEVTSIDDFLQGGLVSIIKLDPGGDIIPGILRGAARTIAQHHPRIVAGVYHSLESLYRIPILVHELHPEARLYLRHNAYHANETHLYAV